MSEAAHGEVAKLVPVVADPSRRLPAPCPPIFASR